MAPNHCNHFSLSIEWLQSQWVRKFCFPSYPLFNEETQDKSSTKIFFIMGLLTELILCVFALLVVHSHIWTMARGLFYSNLIFLESGLDLGQIRTSTAGMQSHVGSLKVGKWKHWQKNHQISQVAEVENTCRFENVYKVIIHSKKSFRIKPIICKLNN